jgi:glycine/D-amino acid oxidase-like deaminating enzyme
MAHHKELTTMITIGRRVTLPLAGLAALGLLFGLAAPAFAQTATPPAPDQERRHQRLERLLQRELNWLEGQADHLARAGEAVARTEAFIDKAKAEGKDTGSLEAALRDFQARLTEAQAAHDEAQALLDARAGFDADGQVTDPQAARQTLADAGRALGQARFDLRQAEIDLRQAVREFRRANRPAPVP